MSHAAEESVAHFRRTFALADRLAQYGVAVYHHARYFEGFGSWTLEVGRRHHRFKFDWDGKEFCMTVSTCSKSSGGDPQEWTVISKEVLGGSADSAPFAYVEASIARKSNHWP